MKIIPIVDSGNYGCSPCWLEENRDINASVDVVVKHGQDTEHIYMCGNHAELLDVQAEDTTEYTEE